MKTKSMADLLAGFAADYDFENASDAVRPLAEQLVEDFCPDFELTAAEVERIQNCYEDILERYVVDANDLLDEWAQNAREDMQTRMEARYA